MLETNLSAKIMCINYFHQKGVLNGSVHGSRAAAKWSAAPSQENLPHWLWPSEWPWRWALKSVQKIIDIMNINNFSLEYLTNILNIVCKKLQKKLF
jgi:hypothetical protein